MSYDIELLEPVSRTVIEFDSPHEMKGGTYALSGTRAAEFNVTYNYSKIFSQVLDQSKGIRILYGKPAAETSRS